MTNGTRECLCDLVQPIGNLDCDPWEETLAGSFPDEQFGAALVTADFDCDGDDDLSVGAPAAALPSNGPDLIPEGGAVYVYRSTDAGIGSALPTVLRQGAYEVGGTPEQGDRFGQTLTAGNFNGARRVANDRSCYDLVVAAPGEDGDAGQIQIFEGGPNGCGSHSDHAARETARRSGLLFDDVTMIRQGFDQFAGVDEAGDEFGFALTWTIVSHPTTGFPLRILAVGIPGENQQVGQLRLYRAQPPPPGSQALLFTDFMMFEQGDINGDLVSGDRFASVLMPARAFTQRPWEFLP